jgi:hypothetical protein
LFYVGILLLLVVVISFVALGYLVFVFSIWVGVVIATHMMLRTYQMGQMMRTKEFTSSHVSLLFSYYVSLLFSYDLSIRVYF